MDTLVFVPRFRGDVLLFLPFLKMATTTRSTFYLRCTTTTTTTTLTDYAKDFEAARRVGMHAVLLNRYGEEELAQEWKRRGAIVFDDLMDVVLWLGQSDCQLG
jgi:hypothetical protein